MLEILGERPALRIMMDPTSITLAEVVYTSRYESATTVGDFALRRTNLAWSCSDHGREWAPLIGAALAEELRWPRTTAEKAVSEYEEELIRLGL